MVPRTTRHTLSYGVSSTDITVTSGRCVSSQRWVSSRTRSMSPAAFSCEPVENSHASCSVETSMFSF